MELCDKCDLPATIRVEGYLYARLVCSYHAGKIAEGLGDIEGAKRLSEYAA